MNSVKLLLSVAVLSLSASGAFYAVQNYPVPQFETSSVIPRNQNNNPVSGQPLVEQLAPKYLNDSLNNNLLANTLETENNLTDEVSKDLTQFLIENNPEEPEAIGGRQFIKVPGEQDILNSVLTKSLDKLDKLKPVIQDADLNIASAATNETLNNYIELVRGLFADYEKNSAAALSRQQTEIIKIYQKDGGQFFNNIGSAENSEESQKQFLNLLVLNYEYFSSLITLLNTLGAKLYETAVPEPAIELHKNLLSLVIAKKDIFAEIQTVKSKDPLNAFLNQQVLQAIDSELADSLKKLLSLKIES